MIRKISGLLLGATIAVAASMMPAMQAAAQSDPGIAVGEPNPSGASSYRVRQGDTVESIARSTGVPPAQIIALNPGLGARSLLPRILRLNPSRKSAPLLVRTTNTFRRSS